MSDQGKRICLPAPERATDLVVRRVLDLFHKAPERRWTLEEAARAAGVSRPALGRRFAEALGQSPLRALRSIRMKKAEHLLIETDHGLARVASEVGYESEFAFSRAFTRHTGIRPGQFRRSSQAPVMLAA
jgi:transcriptional regulator GlxA family with amidase domain